MTDARLRELERAAEHDPAAWRALEAARERLEPWRFMITAEDMEQRAPRPRLLAKTSIRSPRSEAWHRRRQLRGERLGLANEFMRGRIGRAALDSDRDNRGLWYVGHRCWWSDGCNSFHSSWMLPPRTEENTCPLRNQFHLTWEPGDGMRLSLTPMGGDGMRLSLTPMGRDHTDRAIARLRSRRLTPLVLAWRAGMALSRHESACSLARCLGAAAAKRLPSEYCAKGQRLLSELAFANRNTHRPTPEPWPPMPMQLWNDDVENLCARCSKPQSKWHLSACTRSG